MLTFFLLLASLLVAQTQAEKIFYAPEEAESLFEEFIKNFNKQYSSEEVKTLRFNIFKEHLKSINEKNAKSSSAEYGITRFADLTMEEFRRDYTGLKTRLPLRDHFCKDSSQVKFTDSAPESLDWRKKNAVTDIKNQQNCGSCWAFSATGNLEGQYAIKYKKLVALSEQQLVDCDTGDDNCFGGFMANAMKWLSQNGGAMTEKDYPYKAEKEKCVDDKSKAVVKVTGCNVYRNKTEEELKEILANVGPLSIGVAASSFPGYDKGIHHCNSSDTEVNHGVLLVGYGKEGNAPYWIVKNSWGESFGEKGYIRLAMYENACYLLQDVVSGIIE